MIISVVNSTAINPILNDTTPIKCTGGYILNEQGKCELAFSAKIAGFAYSLMSTFRIQSAQQLFFLLGNLDLYKYHRTNYTGFFQEFLGYANIIQDNIWVILKLEQIQNFLN